MEPLPVTLYLKGELMESLELLAEAGQTSWLAVITDGVVPSTGGAEVFLDRCLETCDMAHSGYAFTVATPELEAWAKRQKLAPDRWKAGQPLKHPKLTGPLTLWRRTFLKKQLKAWRAMGEKVSWELFLTAAAEKGRAVMINTNPVHQGWISLQLPPLSTLASNSQL